MLTNILNFIQNFKVILNLIKFFFKIYQFFFWHFFQINSNFIQKFLKFNSNIQVLFKLIQILFEVFSNFIWNFFKLYWMFLQILFKFYIKFFFQFCSNVLQSFIQNVLKFQPQFFQTSFKCFQVLQILFKISSNVMKNLFKVWFKFY